jgi:hypothetical protein
MLLRSRWMSKTNNGKASMKGTLLFAVTLALLATQSPAGSTDLKIIRCSLSPEEDAKIGSTLQHLDDKLVQASVAYDFLGDAMRKFIRACRALKGDLTQNGPYMDAMVDAANGFDFRVDKLKVIYHSLQTPPGG